MRTLVTAVVAQDVEATPGAFKIRGASYSNNLSHVVVNKFFSGGYRWPQKITKSFVKTSIN
jgi:hypothetical protein